MPARKSPLRNGREPLRIVQEGILEAARGFGLDPIRTVFELVAHDELNEIAAYGGFPTRYPHWRFGMGYEELAKGYTYGLSKIYELVINNDPCYAYLMKSNALVDQKMVIAHVYGHSDFFKNNMWFSQTHRRMIDEMANHGTRIRRYLERHGEKTVEEFLDAALSLEWLIDYHSVYSPTRRRTRYDFSEPEDPAAVRRFRADHDYMDRYINPPEYLEAQRKHNEDRARQAKRFPERPEKDVLAFLIEHAPIENWQRDVLSIVREESYYIAPQALTKIMNEGWATYWHAKIMTEKALDPAEVVDFADHHSATLGSQPGALNPYKLGVELWRDIEDRWNRGRFGREYDECDDLARKRQWDLNLGLGREKIFEVRRIYNDLTFIDDFLTKEFCEDQNLFVYRHNAQSNRYEIGERDFETVKRTLLFRLTNMGHPLLQVVDGNFRNRSELLLRHAHEGFDLDLEEARDTLRNLQRIWQRPVNLETVVEDQLKLLTYDGQKHSEEDLSAPAP
ncbi:MAG TPA: SpoVR family protein [Planctomycetota bacterium]|nr:SpoVR family protein [Planctomycetota bacterium]